MKNSGLFVKICVSITLVIFFIIYILFAAGKIDEVIFHSIILAVAITSVNFFLGILAIKLGLTSSDKIFIISILGGMLVRLILLLGAVFISLKFLDINHNSFIFTVLFFYIYYLTIEVFYLNSKKK